MTCTAYIHQDVTEPNGRRRIWVEYTHVESGRKIWGGVQKIDTGTDAQALVDARCAGIDEDLMRQEREHIARKVLIRGLDRNDYPPVFNAPGRIEKFLVRRIWNAMRGVRPGERFDETLRHIVNSKAFLDTVTQARLRGILNIDNAEANTFRANVDALATADGDLDWVKARPPQDEDEP